MRKYSIAILWVLFILIISCVFCFYHAKKVVVSSPQAIAVETSFAVEKIFSNHFETIGSLASLDRIDISPELSGQIANIHFKPGKWVEEGTLLIELDNRILKSELASAEASLILSEMNYKRLVELSKRQISSEQALDQAAADLQQKKNTVKVRQAQLEKLSLHAPFSGTLGARKVSIGQYVKVGQPLVNLVANQRLRVEYTLPERLLAQLKTGQKVYVYSDAFPKQCYEGKINYISPSIDRETRTIAVEAVINNEQRNLSAGLFVKVKHQLGQPNLHLLVPEESLIPTINGQKIFVLKGNKAFAKRVITGIHHFDMVEIREGLSKKDIIVIRGQHKLKEGSLVTDATTQVTM